jgi:hypothetical protein
MWCATAVPNVISRGQIDQRDLTLVWALIHHAERPDQDQAEASGIRGISADAHEIPVQRHDLA